VLVIHLLGESLLDNNVNNPKSTYGLQKSFTNSSYSDHKLSSKMAESSDAATGKQSRNRMVDSVTEKAQEVL
jgi:hypothetical protein